MYHKILEVRDKFQGNFTLHTLPPDHTCSVTGLPLSIFYRKIKKICHLRETYHQIHCTSKETALVPIRRTKCAVIPGTPLEWPGSAAISLLCCPCAQAAPCFHLSAPQAGSAHRSPCVFLTLLARPPGRP